MAEPSPHQRQMLKLFNLSVLKQRKWAEIRRLLGPTAGLRGLDVGSDNGVISFFLRRQGGRWTSGDLDAQTVEAIRAMVGGDVIEVDGGRSRFADGTFDRVVLIDCLEHLRDDRSFLGEVARITKPGGEVILNVPHAKDSGLRRLRLAIGQTDEAHGHLRPGYTFETLKSTCPASLEIIEHHTYSGFFSELIDTAVTWAVRRAKGQPRGEGVKGTVVTASDLSKHKKLLIVYAALYPLFWSAAQLDRLLLAFQSGYMLIARARRNEKSSHG